MGDGVGGDDEVVGLQVDEVEVVVVAREEAAASSSSVA
jgi:hypothetical protein